MARSIIGLLLIGAIAALMADVLSNLARIAATKEVVKQIRRYEEAFRSVRNIEKYIRSDKEIPEPRIVVKDDKDDLPKFGDE